MKNSHTKDLRDPPDKNDRDEEQSSHFSPPDKNDGDEEQSLIFCHWIAKSTTKKNSPTLITCLEKRVSLFTMSQASRRPQTTLSSKLLRVVAWFALYFLRLKSGRGANNGGFLRNPVTSSKVIIASILWSRFFDYRLELLVALTKCRA